MASFSKNLRLHSSLPARKDGNASGHTGRAGAYMQGVPARPRTSLRRRNDDEHAPKRTDLLGVACTARRAGCFDVFHSLRSRFQRGGNTVEFLLEPVVRDADAPGPDHEDTGRRIVRGTGLRQGTHVALCWAFCSKSAIRVRAAWSSRRAAATAASCMRASEAGTAGQCNARPASVRPKRPAANRENVHRSRGPQTASRAAASTPLSAARGKSKPAGVGRGTRPADQGKGLTGGGGGERCSRYETWAVSCGVMGSAGPRRNETRRFPLPRRSRQGGDPLPRVVPLRQRGAVLCRPACLAAVASR